MKIIYKNLFLISIFWANSAFAVTCGVDPCARITGLSDVNFGSYAGSGDAQTVITYCAHTANDDLDYFVSANGDGTANAFVVDLNGTEIPVKIEFQEGSSGFFVVTPGNSQGFSRAANVDETCAVDSPDSDIRITIDEADLTGAPAGIYTGTISVDLTPE